MRPIDADVLKADVLEWENCYNGFSDTYDKARIIDAIDEQPTIDAEPVRRGRWIREPNCWYRCTVCGDHYPSIADNMKYNYCPNCGAKKENER